MTSKDGPSAEFQNFDHLTCNMILRINQNEVIELIVCHKIVINYMSNGLMFELDNICLRNFQARCQMNRNKCQRNFTKIG